MGKIFRDPLHDLIRVDDQQILDLIDCLPMQRLRKIRQLGVANLVFPGAEHSRFTHSLGTYHLAKQAMDYINRIGKNRLGQLYFPDETKKIVCIAALLHDVGHGPFSHLFEKVVDAFWDKQLGDIPSHEDWTIKIIEKNDQIQKILKTIGSEAFLTLKEILDKTYKPFYAIELISSQLDVDRFDYLLRDTMMTGAQYGQFDLSWMLRVLKIATIQEEEEVLAVDGRRGLNLIEMFLLGRHYMHINVYFHKTIRAAEAMLIAILKRALNCIKDESIESPHPAINAYSIPKEPSIDEYLSLNDFMILNWIEEWSKSSPDTILKDLTKRFYERRLFVTIVFPPQDSRGQQTSQSWQDQSKKYNKVQEFLINKGLDPDYYLLDDDPTIQAYKDVDWFSNSDRSQEIYYLDANKKPYPFSQYRSFLTVAKEKFEHTETRVCVPREFKKEIIKILE